MSINREMDQEDVGKKKRSGFDRVRARAPRCHEGGRISVPVYEKVLAAQSCLTDSL